MTLVVSFNYFSTKFVLWLYRDKSSLLKIKAFTLDLVWPGFAQLNISHLAKKFPKLYSKIANGTRTPFLLLKLQVQLEPTAYMTHCQFSGFSFIPFPVNFLVKNQATQFFL